MKRFATTLLVAIFLVTAVAYTLSVHAQSLAAVEVVRPQQPALLTLSDSTDALHDGDDVRARFLAAR